MSRFTISIVLFIVGSLTGFESQLLAQTPPVQAPSSSSLNLIVISGRDGANVLKPTSAVPPGVEVRDANNHPVIGAIVTFSAPVEEPTITFPNGKSVYSMVTDMSGRALVENASPLGAGSFKIDISATYDDNSGHSVIQQANYATLKTATGSAAMTSGNRIAEPGSQGLSKGAKIGIVVAVVAVGAGLGAYFGARGHSASNSSSISAGSPTVGAPH